MAGQRATRPRLGLPSSRTVIEEPSWTIGIEEEYLLVDQDSGALVQTQPPGLIERVAELRHGQVSPEFYASQLEIGTGVCEDMRRLRADVGLLRLAVTEAAHEHGLAPIAARTSCCSGTVRSGRCRLRRNQLLRNSSTASIAGSPWVLARERRS